MNSRVCREVAVGILIIDALIVLIFLAFKIGGAGLGRKNIYIIRAKDALGLVENSSVMIAGVEVGKIRHLSIEGDHALIEFAVDSTIKLREGTKFYIRGKSLLGEKYLDVIPSLHGGFLPENTPLDEWATHETEIGDFVTKINQKYMPSPEDFRRIFNAFMLLLVRHSGDIERSLEWFGKLTEEIPPERAGEFIAETESFFRFLHIVESDYMRWRKGVDNAFNLLNRVSRDYSTISAQIQKYGGYFPDVTTVSWYVENVRDILLNTRKLLCNLNYQLHKFDNVDFETLKEILEDEGFKVRFWGRSREERERDIKLFRSYQKNVTGEGCR